MADVILEEVSRALLLLMKDDLPSALSGVASEMATEDAAFYAALGEPVPATTLDVPATYVYGSHPSITLAELTDYPMLVALCYAHESARDERADTYEVITASATVEMAAVNSDIGTMNRIAMRNAKAIHRVILGNRNLGGLIRPVDKSPSVIVSQATTRRVAPDRQDQIYVQACLLEYSFSIEQPW